MKHKEKNATSPEEMERQVRISGILGLPNQSPVILDAWTGRPVKHRNQRLFSICEGCPAVEPTELTEEVLTAAIELEDFLGRAGKEFNPELIYGDLSQIKRTEWTESKPAGLIIKEGELWHVRQAADGTHRFCLVYWKSECKLEQLGLDIWRAPTFFMPLATSWSEGLSSLRDVSAGSRDQRCDQALTKEREIVQATEPWQGPGGKVLELSLFNTHLRIGDAAAPENQAQPRAFGPVQQREAKVQRTF